MSKKILAVLLAVMMIVSVLPVAVFAASDVQIIATTDKNEYEKGDEVTVSVKFNAANKVLATGQARLSYKTSELAYVSNSLVEGAYFSQFNTSDLSSQDADKETAYIDALFSTDDQGFLLNGEGEFFTVKFTILSDSVSAFDLTVVTLADNDLEDLTYEVTQPVINMKQEAAEPLVVYIADEAKGTGDGSSAANAMGNGEAYATAIAATETGKNGAEDYMQSALYKALAKIEENGAGGTIVITGDLTMKVGKGVTSGTYGGGGNTGTTNFYAPNGATQDIKLTSKGPDGVDYQAAGAKLILDTRLNTKRIFFASDKVSGNDGGSFTFEYLNIHSVGTTQGMYIGARAMTTVFGEGLVMTKEADAQYPIIIGGVMWGATNDHDGDGVAVDVTVKSGTFYQYQTQNFPNAEGASSAIKGDVNINILGGTVLNSVTYGSYSSPKKNGGQITGNVNVTVANATVGVIQLSNVMTTGTTDISGHADVLGDVHITINDGATVGRIDVTGRQNYTVNDTKVLCGQIHGNAYLIYNGTGEKGINIADVYLGYGAFATEYDKDNPENGGKLIVKYNGNNWTANTQFGNMLWMGNGDKAPFGNRYTVVDFSGMTPAEYWAKTYIGNGAEKALNKGYTTRLATSEYPASGPNGETYYGAGKNGNVGFDEVIAPTDAIPTKIEVKTAGKTVYNPGETFDNSGFVYTVTYNNNSSKEVSGSDVVISKTDAFTAADNGSKITATLNGFDAITTEIEITIKLPVALAVKTPGKAEYFIGDTFDNSGYVYTVTYNTEETEDVADNAASIVIDKTDVFAEEGDIKVTASLKDYADIKAEITVNVKKPTEKLQSIAITAPATKTEYFVGQTLDLTGLEITATYIKESDSSEVKKVIDNANLTITPAISAALTVADTTVSITYTEAGVTAEAVTYAITVSEPQVTEIAVKDVNAVAKREYYKGEALDLTGLVIVATYNFGEPTEVALADLTTVPANGAILTNETAVTITYAGKTTTLLIEVTDVESVTIKESLEGVKTEYKPGEKVDLTNIVVVIDGEEVALSSIAGVEITSGEIKAGDTEIKVSFKLGSETFTLSIPITVKNSMSQAIYTSWVMWVSKNLHTVTFVDHDGTVLATKQVAPYSFVVGPSNPTRAGYTFKGWDKNLDRVTSDMTVTAQYEKNS